MVRWMSHNQWHQRGCPRERRTRGRQVTMRRRMPVREAVAHCEKRSTAASISPTISSSADVVLTVTNGRAPGKACSPAAFPSASEDPAPAAPANATAAPPMRGRTAWTGRAATAFAAASPAPAAAPPEAAARAALAAADPPPLPLDPGGVADFARPKTCPGDLSAG